MTAAELRDYLHAHIPLTRALAIDVLAIDDDHASLSAPLAPSVNHRQTAFGGSVSALAILAGWAWLHARLATLAPAARLVIQRQEMDYLLPVDDAFVASCLAPTPAAWERFARLLAARGRGRIELAAEVSCRGRLTATFRGTYVAIASERADQE
jgi:thioesterase domain-containing protein